ncbi:MAG: chemotaxis protein CheW [endosymbiont of Galathealinum brachiosum]|uniref:Chemotaxis protein CheW n=1 Tax=endosymbiont of Galathealinum brachiosum TaxID=2200906 RepID=A0A370DMZ7_9GAMM|nr:MAG: chemotaxis protein CheW [endosymbiont of Galathealinum brachiosum]
MVETTDSIDLDSTEDASQFLTFKLSGEELAVPIMQVKEIIEYDELTNVPMVPEFIAGAINLRGSVVPVVNLAIKFGLEPCEITRRTCVIIMEIDIDGEHSVMGMLVDKVLQVIDIADENIDPAPSFGAQIRTDFIRGMAKLEDRFIIILAINKVLSVEEIAVVGNINDDGSSEVTVD